MNRIGIAMILLAAGALPAAAQRLDGCPVDQPKRLMSTAPSEEAMNRGLRDSGIDLTGDALIAALRDPRADVRSLAALKLPEIRGNAAPQALMQAWDAEEDRCTKVMMGLGLGFLMPGIVFDSAQHPGRQPWVTPFRACTSSEPPIMTLTLDQVSSNGPAGTTVRILVRNLTKEALAFVMAPPEELFSVTIFDQADRPVKVVDGKERMYDPTYKPVGLLTGHEPTFLPLPPQADVHFWTWNVGDDFDISEPGTYRVSLGGRLAYLNTTVCSNTIEIKIGN